MDNIDTTSSDEWTNADRFHADFDEAVLKLMEPVREALIESVESCTQEEIIGQLLMNLLPVEVADGAPLDAAAKVRLLGIANHMGPDWAQALYRAAVFITRVA